MCTWILLVTGDEGSGEWSGDAGFGSRGLSPYLTEEVAGRMMQEHDSLTDLV